MGDAVPIRKRETPVVLRVRNSHRWALVQLFRAQSWGDTTPALVRRRERQLRPMVGDWDVDALLEARAPIPQLDQTVDVVLELEAAIVWSDLITRTLPQQPHATAMMLVDYGEALSRGISGDGATPAAEG